MYQAKVKIGLKSDPSRTMVRTWTCKNESDLKESIEGRGTLILLEIVENYSQILAKKIKWG